MPDACDCGGTRQSSPGVGGRTSAAGAPLPLPSGYTRTTHLHGGIASGPHIGIEYRGIEHAIADLAAAEEHKVAAIREVAASVRAVAWVALLIAGLALAVIA